MADNIFDIEIITPDRVFYKGETDFLEFNTQNGEIGVYKNHIPLTTVLAPGIVTIHNGDEEKIAAIHYRICGNTWRQGHISRRACRVA